MKQTVARSVEFDAECPFIITEADLAHLMRTVVGILTIFMTAAFLIMFSVRHTVLNLIGTIHLVLGVHNKGDELKSNPRPETFIIRSVPEPDLLCTAHCSTLSRSLGVVQVSLQGTLRPARALSPADQAQEHSFLPGQELTLGSFIILAMTRKASHQDFEVPMT